MSEELLSQSDWFALWLSVKLAGITVILLLIFATPLAWWLAFSRAKFKFLVEAMVALPLVLPPTVLGFYLLLLLGRNGPLAGLDWAFSFQGLVLASMIYSLPFVVQPIQSSLSQMPKAPLEAAATLGAGFWDRFFSVVLPLCKSGFITAVVLGFAHTLGEFGVVLMIGGNLGGETRVASIAIYEHVESLQWSQAHGLALVLLMMSFVLLLLVYAFNGRNRKVAL
ncbi:molybdate ABC transporter permease subunit [Marinicella rhabdoformis]|uniref:molybdate ABC transporter permease subunit n=1 Tax=Marinicella rhabdoformis TaxID=2580566 RepID=UPI0031B63C92